MRHDPHLTPPDVSPEATLAVLGGETFWYGLTELPSQFTLDIYATRGACQALYARIATQLPSEHRARWEEEWDWRAVHQATVGTLRIEFPVAGAMKTQLKTQLVTVMRGRPYQDLQF